MTTRTITLFDRRPVTIDEDEWPVIAEAHDYDDRRHPFQANREWVLKIRKKEPGGLTACYLVYGVYLTKFDTELDRRGGFLIKSNLDEDITQAVVELVKRLDFDIRLGDELLADMPAEVL